MDDDPKNKTNGNTKRKIRTFIEVFLVAVLVGLLIYFIGFQDTDECITEPCEGLENLDCYNSLIEVENFIDPLIDPCHDFHGFVCGGFIKSATKTGITSQKMNQEAQVQNELSSMITDPIYSTDSPRIQLQKQFFQNCMDEELDQTESVFKLIDEIGGWPLLQGQQWKEEEFDWISVLVKCKQLGLPFDWLLRFGIYHEDKNYLMITYPWLFFTSSSLEKFIKNLTGSKKHAQSTIAFEKKLINVIDHSLSTLTIKTVKQLQDDYPKLNWLDWLNNLTEPILDVTEETEIASTNAIYFYKLHDLLSKTSKRIQANYIVWKIVEYFAPFMTNFRPYFYPETINESRIDFCMDRTRKSFPLLSQVEYVKKYYNSDAKKEATELVESIRSEFVHRLQIHEWWNSTLGDNYVKTFAQMNIDVGGWEDILDEELINRLLQYSNTEPNQTFLEMITDRAKSDFKSLLYAVNETSIDFRGLEIMDPKALFYNNFNRMIVPWSLLHGFFYDPKRPKYLNYASLGVMVAERFVAGVRFTDFNASSNCFEADYINMTSQNASEKAFWEDSVDVTSEVVSEIVGRDIAYAAYQKWLTDNEEESHQPYSANQLFWIKSSLINCQTNPVAAKAETDSLAKYKNVLSARHSVHFARDFGCAPDSPMNPTKKC